MLLGFKKRFVDPIKIGTKVHTLRNNPKRKPKIGEQLHMYSGLKTNKCQLISKNERLISKQKAWIKIVWQVDTKNRSILKQVKVCIDGNFIGGYRVDNKNDNAYSVHKFVRYDGFEDIFDFVNFFIEPYNKQTKNKPGLYQLVQSMNLYHWTDLRY